jgi:hypothetical protein
MWYYSINGGQEGPFDDARLDQLIAEGVVTPATFVWKEGMAEWTPLGQLRAAGSAAPAAEGAGAASCSVCGRQVGADNLIELLGRRVCADCKPRTVQAMREGVAATLSGTTNAWCDGKNVVTRDNAELPARCYKCNETAPNRPLKRKLYWHPPAYYWLIVLGVVIRIGILLYIIVAIIVRKRATVEVHICPRHRTQRRLILIGGWGGFILGFFMILGTASIVHGGWIVVLSVLLCLGSLITLMIGLRLARASRINKDGVVWMRGAGKEFLASLPPWTGQG